MAGRESSRIPFCVQAGSGLRSPSTENPTAQEGRRKGGGAVMGILKGPLSLRIRQELRGELEEFAAGERRTLGNLGEILLEWAFEQLKFAGSTERLFRRQVPIPRNPSGNYRRKQPQV